MFFFKELSRTLTMHPRFFGPNLHTKLLEKLTSEVEGTCQGKHGFIIAVTQIKKIQDGKIQEGTGLVIFPISFTAIVFRPFRGEVLDAVVDNVTKMGLYAMAGPLRIFISAHQIPSDMKYNSDSAQPSFSSDEKEITTDSDIRLKILGIRIDATDMSATGSLTGDYLDVS